MWRTLETEGSWEGEVWDTRKNGDVFPLLVTVKTIHDAKSRITHYVFSFSDITTTKRDADAIHKLAFFDPLTHLSNRRALIDTVSQALNSSQRHIKSLALLSIDLDKF